MNKSLDIIIPFFHKMKEFTAVFPLNKQYLCNNNIKIIICMDESDSEKELVNFVSQYPDIKFKIIINRKKHTWRSPTKAINVGIKNSNSDYILIVSPESKFVGNLPAMMLNNVSSSTACIGRLNSSGYGDFLFFGEEYVMNKFKFNNGIHYYGSICFPRNAAILVGGYDECMDKWGGDDDNFRARLKLNGTKILTDENINILHLVFEYNINHKYEKNSLPIDYIYNPTSKICNKCFDTWGDDFSEVIFNNY